MHNNNSYHRFLYLYNYITTIIIIDLYFPDKETEVMFVSEDVGSTSICVVSGATEELTA